MPERNWVPVCRVEDVPPDSGATVLLGGAQIAIFRFSRPDRWFASQNRCPHWNEMVLARGLTGDAGGEPKVACPMHKRTYSLVDGRCLNVEAAGIQTIEIRIEEGMVHLPARLPDSLLVKDGNPCHPALPQSAGSVALPANAQADTPLIVG